MEVISKPQVDQFSKLFKNHKVYIEIPMEYYKRFRVNSIQFSVFKKSWVIGIEEEPFTIVLDESSKKLIYVKTITGYTKVFNKAGRIRDIFDLSSIRPVASFEVKRPDMKPGDIIWDYARGNYKGVITSVELGCEEGIKTPEYRKFDRVSLIDLQGGRRPELIELELGEEDYVDIVILEILE